ncbi:apolipoprotein N-acyltransferase [Breznakiella homolactica]|uniref:Apolipoprotein N-acyltransferase n=1 Tax=Breznakiella homolactica TaxID=2798577 RepID=A0A7T8BAP7_9SPIR|nr:apolipoprotein N-acyltransferase [Breznakiella homolactica]QQO08388.1 apolipoprotein N-acyltransferase [Breznakiella homolactica]
MTPVFSRPGLRRFLLHFCALIAGVVLFAASFPNLLFENGLPLLAWIAYIPIFWLINDVGIKASIFWGALYGYAAYGLFNYWLSVFHPLAGLIVGIIYLFYFAVLFPVLKGAALLFPRRGYILQWALWIAYEYLRTQGFLGYPYGITGYSQWNMLPVIQIASLGGVWAVSALVIFPSAYIARALKNGFDRSSLTVFFRREWFFAALWIAALGGTLIFGAASQKDYSTAPAARFALIQHNTDPWRGGLAQYRMNYETLKRLSLEALDQEDKPDVVVWSETAFVPRIHWHTTYREDRGSYELVRELLDFLSEQTVPFVIGNDDARRELSENGTWERVDYNAAMLFDRGEIAGQYRKLHLVPFTEHFPYGKQLPWVYEALANADTHFWEKGADATVFDINGLRFSTPICFEDTFGYISREFVRNGAEVIVNLTNDAWSHSLPAQMQHLSMAVFRTVENRRSMVRSTASGQTCGIDPNGRIIAMAEPFTESQLTVSVPVAAGTTLYTRWGDYLAKIFVWASLLALTTGIVVKIIKIRKSKYHDSD